jgi:hypothetical protein
MTTEIQWQVTWFPPGKDHVTKSARGRVHAAEIAHFRAEWNPITESREVVTGEWRRFPTEGDPRGRVITEAMGMSAALHCCGATNDHCERFEQSSLHDVCDTCGHPRGCHVTNR